LSAQTQVVPSLPEVAKAKAVVRVLHRKKEVLPALSGVRCFAALNLVLFHFANPKWFGPLAPIVENGYTSVSFFLLLSGFILAYNYGERAAAGRLRTKNFWIARLSRLYPVYLLALLLSAGMLIDEWHVRPHGEFALGLVLTPLLLQGWHPLLATFWNTPAWTMCTEFFFYIIFPAVILIKRPKRLWPLLLVMAAIWLVGMTLPALYLKICPDGDLHPSRYTSGIWMRGLKFTPLPHVPAFLFGIALADLDGRLVRAGRLRLALGVTGLAVLYAILYFGDRMPYPLMHDGLLMPVFALIILGLAGHNIVARFVGFHPFVAVGQASYCLYILHFNLWNLLHSSRLLERVGLTGLDPWLSCGVVVAVSIAATKLIQRPIQDWARRTYLQP
jgi:peptidoglycan/LPS O-acetylase OafA/YrhL